VVYHIGCGDCELMYVGEMERRLSKQIKEHRSSSPVGHHLLYRKHLILKSRIITVTPGIRLVQERCSGVQPSTEIKEGTLYLISTVKSSRHVKLPHRRSHVTTPPSTTDEDIQINVESSCLSSLFCL